MKTKKLPEYTDIIFTNFDIAREMRDILVDNLRYAKENYPDKKSFMSVMDVYNTLIVDNDGISFRTAKASKKNIVNTKDNTRYGWVKRPGIYEYVNGDPSKGYVFEDPVLIE